MQKVFVQAALTSSFPKEMLRAYVVTLPKPGKDPTMPANFRPILLLNTDLKIYAKLIDKWLMDILPSLVHQDQMGFVKGRQYAHATRRIVNINVPC